VSDKPYRVLPRITGENKHFWCGGAEGKLQLLRCASCGYYIHPPAPLCPQCRDRDVEPQAVSGRGTVFTYTVNHQPWNPTMPERYAIALVALDEQPSLRLVANLVECDVDDVHIGMPVEVCFEQHDEVYLPMFRPANA
jgi:uncharacterized protein